MSEIGNEKIKALLKAADAEFNLAKIIILAVIWHAVPGEAADRFAHSTGPLFIF